MPNVSSNVLIYCGENDDRKRERERECVCVSERERECEHLCQANLQSSLRAQRSVGSVTKICVQKKEKRKWKYLCRQRFPRFVYMTATVSHFFLSNPIDSRGKVTTNATNKCSDRM